MSHPALPAPMLTDRQRIEMTVSCRDCDNLPRVANAGQVVDEAGQRIQIMHNGLKVVADGYYGAWMTEIITRLGGHHEPQEERVFHEVLRHLGPDATMIELGGFWSYYTLWFLSGSPARRSVVLEPDPRNIAVGRANAALNGLAPEFVQAFAGPEPKPAVTHATDTVRRNTLPQRSVADLMAASGFTRLDLLHCDIQGAETGLIPSLAPLVREDRLGFGVFSTHAEAISGDPLTHQTCLAHIAAIGGHVLVEHDVHESYSGDGLIVAWFGRAPIAFAEPAISRNRYATALFRNPLYDLAERERAGIGGAVLRRLRALARRLLRR